MRLVRVTAVAIVAGVFASGGAVAQQDDSGADNLNAPDRLRCSALAELDEGARPTAVYFVAGYYRGQRDAMTIAMVGQSAESAGQTAASAMNSPAQPAGGQPAAASPPSGAAPSPAGVIPSLSMDQILAACAQSPDSRIADIVTANGGLAGQ